MSSEPHGPPSCEVTIQICEEVDTIATHFEQIIVTGDFNLPKMH